MGTLKHPHRNVWR